MKNSYTNQIKTSAGNPGLGIKRLVGSILVSDCFPATPRIQLDFNGPIRLGSFSKPGWVIS